MSGSRAVYILLLALALSACGQIPEGDSDTSPVGSSAELDPSTDALEGLPDPVEETGPGLISYTGMGDS